MSEHGLRVKFYFTQATAHKVLADLREYAGDPTVKIKLLSGDGDGWHIQVCTDTWGGDPNNDSHPCPGSPGCP